MLACLTFIFCSLLELAVVGFLARDTPCVKDDKRSATNTNTNLAVRALISSKERFRIVENKKALQRCLVLESYFEKLEKNQSSWNCLKCLTPDSIDTFSSVAFPTLFSIFNFLYWYYYLSA